MANPATVIIVGDVQTLVEPIFNATKTGAIKLQPPFGVESARFGAGNERHVFILAALSLAEQTGGLRYQGEANLLR